MTACLPVKYGRRRTRRSKLASMVCGVSLALGAGTFGTSYADELAYEPDVVLVMKDMAFHVLKEVPPEQQETPVSKQAFSLPTGQDLVVLLRNDDKVAHEFVSPLLLKVDNLQLSGRATLVYTHTAVGVRVEPTDSVLLRFEIPDAGYDQFHFWCNIHGMFFGDTMRGEIFVLNAKPPSS
jgi:hypothetical protein